MAAPAKFLFDTDFSAPDRMRSRNVTAAEVAQKIAAAEARAYRDGYDAALARGQGGKRSPRRAGAGDDRRCDQGYCRALFDNREPHGNRSRRCGARRRRNLAGELIAREPLGEVTSLVADCFAQLVSTPHLVVRINHSLYEAAHERIEALAKQSGFAGRLVILAEPDIQTGDCRIEWADGGVVLERAAIEAKINELVGRYIASRNQA